MSKGSGGTKSASKADLQSMYENGSSTRQIFDAAGYTGKPKVVQTLNESDVWEGVTLYRGIQTAQYVDDLKYGTMHFGGGTSSNGVSQINALGDGIYSYGGGDAQNMVQMYGKNIVKMGLSKSAKVADYDTLASELVKNGLKRSYVHDKISAYAASKGYDAIHQDRGKLHAQPTGRRGLFGASDIVVILNRKKLIIEK